MKNPIIGVIPIWDDEKDSVWMLPGYMRGIEEAGAVPVILPLTASETVLERAAGVCGGFLFTGGHDVDPKLYGEVKRGGCGETCEARDRMEAYIFREAVLNRNKPAFGICRGIQLFNALLGGSLYQDLPTEHSGAINHQTRVGPPYDTPAHAVRIVPESPLYKLIGKERIEVNSFHHQGINRIADGLQVMAVADDGLVEAVCMPGHPYVWAVQWHPEFCPKDEVSKKIFTSFVMSAAPRGRSNKMRRADKEITDIDGKISVIKKCKVCRIGLSENDMPYVIPLNYGYAFENNALTLFFHGATEGKKLDIINNNNNACFEIDCDTQLIEAEKACNYSCAFKSVIGFGKIILLENPNEKIDGLNKIMRHQTDREAVYDFTPDEIKNVCVYKMVVEEFTGKQKEFPRVP